MSIHAGTILHIGGNNVIDRIQSAGLGDVRTPNETIREVGNPQIVDKIPGDPDYTFTLETLDVSTELEAWLTGAVGSQASASSPGASDPDGTVYDFADCGYLNIPSPWKDPTTGTSGDVTAGHLVPGYYVRRIRYRFGVTDNSSQEVELAGGSYYYADGAPVEQYETGDGAEDTFVVDDDAIGHRKGGAEGTTFKRIFGVIVDGELQTEGVDYTQNGTANATPDPAAEIVFTEPPETGAVIRFCYFTDASVSWPAARHASTIVKPAAVRGRNICVFLGSGGQRAPLGGIQSAELEATVDADLDREFCHEEPTGRTINGTDVTGTITQRSKNADVFLATLAKVTGLPEGEVIGHLNTWAIPLEIQIQNPKNPAEILKTLYVADAKFSVPGTPARVNAPTDFAFGWESATGTYQAIKGEM